MNIIAKAQKGLSIAGYKIAKNSPAILAVAGVVGFGFTAVLAYKARPKVEAIVEEVEKANAEGTKVDNYEVGLKVVKALALPVAVGVASTASIVLSYRIMHNRIVTLGSVLASVKAAQQALENKVKERYGEQAYNELIGYDRNTVTLTDADGNQTETVEQRLADIDGTVGDWYENSSDYVRDNHDYNLGWIDEMHGRLQKKLFAKGRLTVNDVRTALGFQPIRSASLLGWGQYDYFNIDKIVYNEESPDGKIIPKILVKWSMPEYIWMENVDTQIRD